MSKDIPKLQDVYFSSCSRISRGTGVVTTKYDAKWKCTEKGKQDASDVTVFTYCSEPFEDCHLMDITRSKDSVNGSK